MCQWSQNLRERLKDFPTKNAEQLDDQIVARLVPKFHLAAHKEDCQVKFSLNYEPGVGRSDMEGPERTWFGLQGGGSTKDQGPGYWSDAMDDKFGHWNWSKLVRLGRDDIFVPSCVHADPIVQAHSLRKSMSMLSINRRPMKKNLLPFVSAYHKRLLISGKIKYLPGSSIEVSQTHTSTPHPVRSTPWQLLLSLIQ